MINHYRLFLFSLGLLIESILLTLLLNETYQPYFPALWLLALTLLFFSFYEHSLNIKLSRISFSPSSILAAFIIFFFFIINISTITHWYFSAIGDEYEFFHQAKRIAEGQVVNIFDHRGAYQIIPMLSSFYQGLMMKLLGINNFGWKTGIIILIGLSLIPYYHLVKNTFNKTTALAALSVLAFSHYLWGYLHTGYSNVEPIALTIFCFYFFWMGFEKYKKHLFFLSGVFAGLGFYTFFSSRDAIVILTVFLFLSFFNLRKKIITIAIPLYTGFIATFLPIALVAKEELITKMLERAITNAYGTELRGISLIINNLYRSIIAFFLPGNFGPYTSGPHVYGALLDTVSGIFFIIGFFVSILRINKPIYKFLFLWFFVSLFTVGGMSQYAWTNVSRLHYLLVPIAIFAGIGFEKTLSFIIKHKENSIFKNILLLLFIGTVLVMNLYRFIIETPRKKPITQESLVVKELRVGICREFDISRVAIVDENGEGSIIFQALKSYPVPTPAAIIPSQLLNISLEQFKCIIFVHPQNYEMQSILSTLTLPNGFSILEQYDPSHNSSIMVLRKR